MFLQQDPELWLGLLKLGLYKMYVSAEQLLVNNLQ